MKNYYILGVISILLVMGPSLSLVYATTVEMNTNITAEGGGSATVNSQTNTSIKTSTSNSGSTTVSKKIEVTTNGQKQTIESTTLGTTSIDIRNGTVQIKENSDEDDSASNVKKSTSTPTPIPPIIIPSAQAQDISLGAMIRYRVRLFLQKMFRF
ncbi:MAG: hypothetical protein UZ21_OP11001000989 [Microgenomates bacterium OLB22]|nr:MAG: hypothetical protein UZ21_OP11001000989 [Microgenomates bacterium OLB22]